MICGFGYKFGPIVKKRALLYSTTVISGNPDMNTSHDDPTIDEQLALALRCCEQGDPWQAVVHCKTVLSGNESHAEALTLLGRCLAATGDLPGFDNACFPFKITIIETPVLAADQTVSKIIAMGDDGLPDRVHIMQVRFHTHKLPVFRLPALHAVMTTGMFRHPNRRVNMLNTNDFPTGRLLARAKLVATI